NHAWLRAFGRRSIVIDLARERARHQVGFEDSTSSPLLTVVPVINIPPSLILCETVPLLNLAFELLSTAIYHVEIVVGELSPLFLDPAFNLLPISFDSIPVHLDLRRSAHDMAGEPFGSAMVPCQQPEHGFVKLSYRLRARMPANMIFYDAFGVEPS